MHRVVCLQQTLIERPNASRRRLIACPDYTYCVFVTTVPSAAEVVTRPYAGRADSENRIKELKEDLSLGTFCLQSFDATDAEVRTGCVLYNLLTGFQETGLLSCWFERRLRGGRDLVFLVGADPTPKANRLLVRFAVPQRSGPSFSSACGHSWKGYRLRSSWSGTWLRWRTPSPIPLESVARTVPAIQSTLGIHATSP